MLHRRISYIALFAVLLGLSPSYADDDCPGGHYPPIYITVNTHGHAYKIDDPTYEYGNPEGPFTEHWIKHQWIQEAAEAVGAKVSFLMSGQYARNTLDYCSLFSCPAGLNPALAWATQAIDSGHTIGAHFHEIYEDKDIWRQYSDSTMDNVNLAWESHLSAVRELKVAAGGEDGIFHVDGSATLTGRSYSSEVRSVFNENLVASNGVEIISVGDKFSQKQWNTVPWNPYRQESLGSSTEDYRNWERNLSVPSIGQVGKSDPSGHHRILATSSQLKRHFLLLRMEWRERERMEGDAPIFSFGIMTHPGQNAEYQDEMEEILGFLQQQTQEKGVCGSPVAEFTTSEHLSNIIFQRERNYPEGFQFPYDEKTGAFPYSFEKITLALKDAELIHSYNIFDHTEFHEFQRRTINREADQNITCIVEDELQEGSIYLLATNLLEPTILNAASLIGADGGWVLRYDPKIGAWTTTHISSLEAETLTLTQKPLLLATYRDHLLPPPSVLLDEKGQSVCQ